MLQPVTMVPSRGLERGADLEVRELARPRSRGPDAPRRRCPTCAPTAARARTGVRAEHAALDGDRPDILDPPVEADAAIPLD